MAHYPLDGIRVLDFSLAAVGPFCARVLCDLGAEVIHVEWPRVKWAAAQTGREESRFVTVDDGTELTRESELFIHVNGGKKSFAVNLKNPSGVEIARSLAATTDVVIENMTPRVMEQLGLQYSVLSENNPGLIMCSLSGFGQSGIQGDRARPCTDPVAQAMSGISWITGERDGPPYAVGGGLGDTVTSIVGATAILAALVSRQSTGEGQYIDLSMVESLAYLDCTSLPGVAMSGSNRVVRSGQQSTYACPMGTFKATGGYIAIQAVGAGPDSPWGRLCGLMGRPDMITDERFRDDEQRAAHVDEMVEAVEAWLCSTDSREGALALLAAERISAGPVLSQEEMLTHEFFAERNTFGTVEYPELGAIRVVEPPFRFSKAGARVQGPAPEMGEHTREIAESALGLDAATIEQYMEADVLFESPGAKRRNGLAGAQSTGR